MSRQQIIDNNARCYKTAISLLTRREHSRFELMNKLRQKPFSKDVNLSTLCDRLEAANYLSDARFAELFIHSRISRGQGEIKIRSVLHQRGVDSTLTDLALLEADIDWLVLAKQQRKKRFGVTIPKRFKERARQSRFLAGRGFSCEIIYLVFH
jgi:regulatory protein